MVVPLGQQYNIGEKPTVVLYTYIDRHGRLGQDGVSLPRVRGFIRVDGNDFWIEECQSHISESNELNIS